MGLSYSYDTSGHRLYSSNTTALNASFLIESYSWDLEGNYKSRFSSGASGGYAANTSFLYDGFGRLKQESGTPTPQSFTYDDNSNRLSNGAKSYTYLPNTNRLYSRDTALPTLDAAGNTLNNGLTNGLGQTYTWDSFGRLVSVTTATSTTQYQYNYLNQRVSKTLSNGTQTLYHYDHEGRLFLETSSTGVMQAWYWYHDNGDVAAIVYGANTPYNATAQEQVLYLHSDHLGTPRIAFDSLKRVVWRWESDAFGTTTPLQDPDKDGKATVINLRFPGQYYDAETQLHYNWNRYYDPQLERYISSDPVGLGGGLNTFGYVSQSPMVNMDYDGLFAQSPIPLPTAAPLGGVATGVGLGAATATTGVVTAFTAGYAVGSAIYPAIAEPLADAIDSVVDTCQSGNGKCKPCTPLVGTIATEVHIVPPSKPHWPIEGSHIHWFKMQQSPYPVCKCFWQRNFKKPTQGDITPVGTVPMTPAEGGGLI